MNHGLAGRRLPAAALQDLTHDDFIDRGPFDPGPGNGFSDDQGPELWCCEGGKTAKVTSNWSPDGSEDDGCCRVAHGDLPSIGFDVLDLGTARPGDGRQ